MKFESPWTTWCARYNRRRLTTASRKCAMERKTLILHLHLVLLVAQQRRWFQAKLSKVKLADCRAIAGHPPGLHGLFNLLQDTF